MYLQAEPDSMEKASDEMLVHTVPPHGSYLLQVQAAAGHHVRTPGQDVAHPLKREPASWKEGYSREWTILYSILQYICTVVEFYVHTSIHTYIHTYIHACIHTYIHTVLCRIGSVGMVSIEHLKTKTKRYLYSLAHI